MGNHTKQRRLAGSIALFCLGIGILCQALAGAASGQEKQKPKPRTDAEITRLLQGKWMIQTTLKEVLPKKVVEEPTFKDGKITVTLHNKKDGTFAWSVTAVIDEPALTRKDTYEGTWKVVEGVLEKTLTKVDSPSDARLKVGNKGRERILVLNDKALALQEIDFDLGNRPVTVTPGAKPMTFKRVKD